MHNKIGPCSLNSKGRIVGCVIEFFLRYDMALTEGHLNHSETRVKVQSLHMVGCERDRISYLMLSRPEMSTDCTVAHVNYAERHVNIFIV